IQADVESHGPIVILASDGTLYRLALGVALNAHVVGLDKTEPSRIDDVGSRRAGDVGASRTVAFFAADVPFGNRLRLDVVIDRMAAIAEWPGGPRRVLRRVELSPPVCPFCYV